MHNQIQKISTKHGSEFPKIIGIKWQVYSKSLQPLQIVSI